MPLQTEEKKDFISLDELKGLINSTVGEAVKTAISAERSELSSDGVRLSEKFAGKPLSKNSPHVEIPTKSAKEGGSFNNLPAHEKMLANIVLRRDVYTGLENQKGFDSTTSGSGLEYIPSVLGNQLLQDLSLTPNIHNLFPSIQVSQMDVDMPNVKGHTHFKISATDAAITEIAGPTTGQTNLLSKKFTGYVDYTVDISEHSVIDILPIIQNNIIESWSRDLDNCIINGDTTATHMDTDTQLEASSYHLRAWKGLRKLALAGSLTTAGGGAVISTTLLANTAKGLGKYSTQLQNLICLVSGRAQWELFKESDWKDQTLLLAKYASEAEIARGLSGYIKTIPVYNSEFVRSDVSATGVNAASGNTLTTGLVVRKDMFIKSLVKELKVWVVGPETDATLAANQKFRVFASVKAGFNPVFVPSTTHPTVNLLINVDD